MVERMKRTATFVVMFLVVFCSASCTNNGIEYQRIQTPGVSYVGSETNYDHDYDTTIISSVSEYDSFLSQDRMEGANTDFLDALSRYDSDSFYQKANLIVIFVEFNDTSYEPSIESIEYEENLLTINVSIYDNGSYGEAITRWAFLLEYSKIDTSTTINVFIPEYWEKRNNLKGLLMVVHVTLFLLFVLIAVRRIPFMKLHCFLRGIT